MDSTIKIPLSRSKVTMIDASDFDKVKNFSWSVSDDINPYACRLSGKRKKVYMHRVITGAKTGQMVDHINGNVLDNRKHNLRLVTPAQNQFNRRKQKNQTSNFLGVSLHRTNKFVSKIHYNTNSRYLGTFDNPYEAAIQYDMAKARIAGEYGSYNFNEIIGLQRLKFLITTSADNITVIFRKKTDGKVRVLYCSISDKFYTSKAHRIAIDQKGLLLAKDIRLNEFRFISIDSIIAAKIDGKFYAKELNPY